MSDFSKSLILKRRTNAIFDLSEITSSNGDMTFEDALKCGIYRINANHQIGIATSTEQGLQLERYPVRVMIEGAREGDIRLNTDVDLCVSYWPVLDASNRNIAFQRKALPTEVPVANLYKYVQNFDDRMWVVYKETCVAAKRAKKVPELAVNPAHEVMRNDIYATLCLANPSEEQVEKLNADIDSYIGMCKAELRYVRFKIENNAFLIVCPHGCDHVGNSMTVQNQNMLKEVGLTIMVNEKMIASRHANVKPGVVTLGAYAIASMFRTGLYESYENKEFVTVLVAPNAADPMKFTVSRIVSPEDYVAPDMLKVGAELNAASVKFNSTLTELGLLYVFLSGLTHYMHNHTTGGTIITGPMLAACGLYKLVDTTTSHEEAVEITKVLYEAVHPSNKRAIANIFFETSKVYTNGRMRGAYRHEKLEPDAFAAIRTKPFPAGAHKAFVCTQAMKKVVMAGLDAFLPWHENARSMIESCRDVLKQGARSHIGAGYYTGGSPISLSAGLDNYLPDLACFMQTFHKADSLAASPHLGPDIAARASSNWAALLRDLRAKDISSVSVEKVKDYLAVTGVGSYGFDPEDKETWAKSAVVSRNVLDVINDIFV